MATKYTDTLNCKITSKSKNTTYIHKGDGAATITFNVQKDDIYNNYTNIPMISNGKDLVIKTIFYSDYFGDKPGKTKTVVTTIKDYKTLELNGTIDIISDDYIYNSDNKCNLNHDVEPGHNGLYGQVSETDKQEFLLGPEGNETVTLSHGGSDYIHSYKGNNTWNLQSDYFTTRTSYTGYDTIYEAAGNDKYNSTNNNFVYIYELAGKDEYKSDGDLSELQAWDFKGNDKYTTKNQGRMDIYDYNGSDEYRFESADRSKIYDFKGNDKYDFSGAEINVANASYQIEDYAGKDKYTISESKGIQIDDAKGNDTYEVSDCSINISNETEKIVISDYVGNDKYTYTNVTGGSINANYDITDGAGNDKYTFDSSTMLHVNDIKGADTYTVKNGSKRISIADDAGKDTYNLAGSSADKVRATITDNGESNDKYNLTYASYGNADTAVTDDGGKDSYKIISSENVKIADVSGNDKYNISGSGTDTITITDESGKDTYNIKGSYNKTTGESVYLKNVTITDTGIGSDKYNIQYTDDFIINEIGADKNNDSYNIISSYGKITEAYGNDSYTISKLRAYESITIYDSDGEKDKLVLKDVNKNNLVALADIRSNGNYRMGSLLLFDESSRGFVNVQCYYHTDVSGNIDGTSNNCEIETIKAGSKKINASSADVYGNFNSIRSDVADWLSGEGHEYGSFDNVEAVLASGNDDAINSLIAEFTYNQ